MEVQRQQLMQELKVKLEWLQQMKLMSLVEMLE